MRVFDRFCFDPEAVKAVRNHPNCEVVTGDVRRLQEAPALLDGIDAVAHLASLSNDPSCALNEDMAHDVNVESSIELARQAAQHSIDRFVFASSCNVYGRGVIDFLDEESPVHPVSPFGVSKHAAESVLLDMAGGGFEPVIARTATMYGVSPRMRFDLAVNQMVARATRLGRIEVRGGGRQWRPFVHVQDAARAFVHLLTAPSAAVAGEVFNIGSDEQNWQIFELAAYVAKAAGDVAVDTPVDDDDLRSYRVRFGKIRERLGFQCALSIDEGIAEVRQFLDHFQDDPLSPAYLNAERMKQLLATPVDEGGEPISARFIALSKPNIGIEEEQAVLHALRSGWLTSGPQIPAFEKAFAETVTAPHAIAVSSCTAALHLGLVAHGVGPGDEVITSPITWASTGNTILNMGAKVVFADIEPDTLNMDPASLDAAITDRTKAIMPVHMAGHPCRLDAIRAIADKHGIPVVEDAAHALGAAYKGTPIGGGDGMTCFSFYAIKNITTMEGGMITLADPGQVEALRVLAANGMAVTAWDRYSRSAVSAPPEVVVPGFKYTLGNVGAAMGLEQLRKFPHFKAARQRLAGLYRNVLAAIDEIALPAEEPDVDHAWHLFIVRLRRERLRLDRNEFAHALRRENIGTGCHFYGLHLHAYYRDKLRMRPEDLPRATQASHEVLSLPLHPSMTEHDVQATAAAIKKVIARARK